MLGNATAQTVLNDNHVVLGRIHVRIPELLLTTTTVVPGRNHVRIPELRRDSI